MTCREKVALEYPDAIDEFFDDVDPHGCPSDYGYLDDDSDLCDADECQKCWDREIPEEKPAWDSYEHIVLEEPQTTTLNLLTNQASYCITDDTGHGVAVGRIKDSGNRREFATGAVRDIQEDKGRCDLMPLDVIAQYLNDDIIRSISLFQYEGKVEYLFVALRDFRAFSDNHTMFLEVAKHFEEGCKKYGENNWQKGIPTHCYIDSAVRHYLKFLRGDKDEPHDRAFVWNLLCCIWTCKHKPELNDYKPKDCE